MSGRGAPGSAARRTLPWPRQRHLTLDPALLGRWTSGGLSFDFAADASDPAAAAMVRLVGTVPYALGNGGQTLLINHQTSYTRVAGDPAGLAGQWRNAPDGEDWWLREDGRYTITFDGEDLQWFGRYAAAGSLLTTEEYRGRVATAANRIQFGWHTGYFGAGLWSLSGAANDTLTVLWDAGGSTVWQRLP